MSIRKLSAMIEPERSFGSSNKLVTRKKKKTMFKILRDYVVSLIIGRDLDCERFVKGQILVEKQTFFHNGNSDGNLFYALLQGTFEDFVSNCKENPEKIKIRDPVGACIFHIAYLYGKYKWGRWLVETFPIECLETYGVPANFDEKDIEFLPYTGENILHMTIMQRQLEETRLILETYQKLGPEYLSTLLHAQTTGHFFQPGGDVGKYFGGYPLLFAVCANGTKMVDLILEFSPQDTLRKCVDKLGNNAFHMCVFHNLPDMYIHLMNLVGPITGYDMMCQSNADGYSPFTLAAVEGSPMFQFLLEKRKTPLWTYGPVTRYLLDLEGLDLPHSCNLHCIQDSDENRTSFDLRRLSSFIKGRNPLNRFDKGEDHSAIEFMCIKNKVDMFSIPEIEQIIQTKWDRIGFPKFKMRFLFYSFVTLLLTLIVCLYEHQEGNTFLPWFTWCLFVFNCLVLTYKFISEFPDMYSQGLSYWGLGDEGNVRGAALLDNWCSTVECLCFDTACLIKVLQYFNAANSDADAAIRIFLAITIVTSWLYLYFFLLGFEMTGVFVVIVADILSSDMPTFLSLFIVMLFGFGSSFALLYGSSGGIASGFLRVVDVIWTLLVYTITGGNEGGVYFPFENGKSPYWFYAGLVMLYSLCIVFLMLNLLIAMMSKTYDELQQTSKLIVLREKYNIMCSFERSYSVYEMTKLRKRYAMVVQKGDRTNFFFQLERTDEDWINTNNLS